MGVNKKNKIHDPLWVGQPILGLTLMVVSQKVCKAECLFELQKYLFFSLCFP